MANNLFHISMAAVENFEEIKDSNIHETKVLQIELSDIKLEKKEQVHNDVCTVGETSTLYAAKVEEREDLLEVSEAITTEAGEMACAELATEVNEEDILTDLVRNEDEANICQESDEMNSNIVSETNSRDSCVDIENSFIFKSKSADHILLKQEIFCPKKSLFRSRSATYKRRALKVLFSPFIDVKIIPLTEILSESCSSIDSCSSMDSDSSFEPLTCRKSTFNMHHESLEMRMELLTEEEHCEPLNQDIEWEQKERIQKYVNSEEEVSEVDVAKVGERNVTLEVDEDNAAECCKITLENCISKGKDGINYAVIFKSRSADHVLLRQSSHERALLRSQSATYKQCGSKVLFSPIIDVKVVKPTKVHSESYSTIDTCPSMGSDSSFEPLTRRMSTFSMQHSLEMKKESAEEDKSDLSQNIELELKQRVQKDVCTEAEASAVKVEEVRERKEIKTKSNLDISQGDKHPVTKKVRSLIFS